MGEHGVFNLDPKGPGTLKLQDVVQQKLLGFMDADYTDKVLAEYVVVLVAHGKTQAQAAGELEAFLGAERAQSFTRWLWDHVAANLPAYADANEGAPRPSKDRQPEQAEASSDSEPSGAPESSDNSEPPQGSPERKQGTAYRSGRDRETRRDTEEPEQFQTDRRHDSRSGERLDRSWERDRYKHREDRDRDAQRHTRHSPLPPRLHEERHSTPPPRLHEGRHTSPPQRLHGGRHSHQERHPRESFHEQRRGREERYREHERERNVRQEPPPPLRGEPSVDERREGGYREEHNARGPREDMLRGGWEEDAGVGQKRVRDRLHTGAVALDEPPPPPRSRPRVSGVPDYARMMGIALKAVAAAADEAAQAAKLGTATVPHAQRNQSSTARVETSAPATHRHENGNVWDRLGLEMVRSRCEGVERSGRGIARKIIRTGPAGPAVTVVYDERQERKKDELQQVRRHVPRSIVVEEEEMQEEEEMNGVEEEESAQEEWQEEQQAEEATYDEREREGDADVDADVAEMKRRMRAVQLEMIKLRAKQREAEQSQKLPPAGLKPLVKALTQQELDARTVFVSNVHFAATKEALAVHFGQAGPVADVRILLDPATGRPKGCAYVRFETEDAAEQALLLDNTSILSRQIKVGPKSSAAAVLQSLPAFVPKPLVPPGGPLRAPRPPLLRRGSTKWVRPGAAVAPPAKSPKSPPVPKNLKWQRTDSGRASGGVSQSLSTAAVLKSGGPASGRSLKYQRPTPYPNPSPQVE